MIDHLRKQERKAQLLQKYGEEVPQFEAPKEDDGESDEIMSALATLTPALRETIVLVIMQGMSYQDAAEILGVPLGTVKSRVSVGLGRLKAYFLKLGK
jgi:RNA polymerase sigma-70 factor (ECF subfamily)